MHSGCQNKLKIGHVQRIIMDMISKASIKFDGVFSEIVI